MELDIKRVLADSRLSPLLLMVGLALWLAFLITGKVEISDMGVMNSLGPLFFMSVLFIISSILISVINQKVTITTYMAIVGIWLALYTLPILIDGTAYFTYSYKVLGYTDYIIERGYYDPIGLPYQNWPGIMLIGTFITHSVGIDAIDLLLIVPVVMKVLQLCIVGIITYKLTNKIYLAMLSGLGFILFDWTAYYLFLPPALGLLLLLTAIYLIVRRYKYREESRYWNVVLILIFFSLAASHLLSTVLCLSVVILMLIGPRIFRRGFWSSKEPLSAKLALGLGLILMAYVVFANWAYLLSSLPSYINWLGNISYVFNTAQEVGGGNPARLEVVRIKILFTFILGILLIIALISLIWKNKKNMTDYQTKLPLVALLCSGFVPIVLFANYGFEAITRSFAYTMPFLAILVALAWRKGRGRKILMAVTVAVLLTSPTLFVISAYGNMEFDFVSREEIEGVRFNYDADPMKNNVYSFSQRAILIEKIEQYRWVKVTSTDDTYNWMTTNRPSYMLWSERDLDSDAYFGGSVDATAYLHVLYSSYGNKVYSTGSYELFQKIL